MMRLNDILRIAEYECRSILRSLPVLLVMGGGIFLYGFLYNYMYSPNVLREVPVVVVDEGHTTLSRQYVRLLDATPQVRVQGVMVDLPQARERMRKGEVAGIIYLPEDLEAKVGRGEASVFVTCNNTMAFLSYAAIKEATGMTMEEYVNYVFSMIDFDSLLGSINYTGVYYVEDGLIYSGLTWNAELLGEEFTLEGDTLTLAGDVSDTGAESTTFQRIVEEG